MPSAANRLVVSEQTPSCALFLTPDTALLSWLVRDFFFFFNLAFLPSVFHATGILTKLGLMIP